MIFIKQSKKDSGWLGVPAPKALSKKLTSLHKHIPKSDLAPDGFEKDPHITLAYGLADKTNPFKVKGLISKTKPMDITLGPLTAFHNDDATVLKFDIKSHDMKQTHERIKDEIGLPGSSHPVFKPHLTVAYLKPGTDISKYKKLESGLKGKSFTATDVDYNNGDTSMELSTKAAQAAEVLSSGEHASAGLAAIDDVVMSIMSKIKRMQQSRKEDKDNAVKTSSAVAKTVDAALYFSPEMIHTVKQRLQDNKSNKPRPKHVKKACRLEDIIKQAQLGIPDNKDYGDISKLPIDKLVTYVLQKHKARKAGLHSDLRLGTKDTGLHSWAVPKARLPDPGDKVLAVQQPVHSHDYAKFQGTIPEGYGAGTVSTQDKGKALLAKVKPDQINFAVKHNGKPGTYTLKQTKDRQWLLINTTT